MITARHQIQFGESVHWIPPPATGAFFAWVKDDTLINAAMRWRRVAGWNVAGNNEVSIPDAPTGHGIQLSAGIVAMNWTDLLSAFDGFDNEIMQITTHADEASMRLLSRDVYLLPAPTSTNSASIAAQERRVLKQLLEMRSGLASMAGGHVKVSTPDGTMVERMEIAVVDRRIAEVRARIAWFEQAAEGNDLPRAVYW